MGAHVSRTDYEWVYTEEPHATRRKQILGELISISRFLVVSSAVLPDLTADPVDTGSFTYQGRLGDA